VHLVFLRAGFHKDDLHLGVLVGAHVARRSRSHRLPRVSRASADREYLNKPVNSLKASSSEITSEPRKRICEYSHARACREDISLPRTLARGSFFPGGILKRFRCD